jgi:hypothetical protein
MAMVEADPRNPVLSQIGEPDGATGMVEKAAQDIKDKVKNKQRALFTKFNPASPSTGWKHTFRIIRHNGKDSNAVAKTGGTGAGYMPLSQQKQKSTTQVVEEAQQIKNMVLAYSKGLIENGLPGKWRTVLRIVPTDAGGNPDPGSGCGCGCS